MHAPPPPLQINKTKSTCPSHPSYCRSELLYLDLALENVVRAAAERGAAAAGVSAASFVGPLLQNLALSGEAPAGVGRVCVVYVRWEEWLAGCGWLGGPCMCCSCWGCIGAALNCRKSPTGL